MRFQGSYPWVAACAVALLACQDRGGQEQSRQPSQQQTSATAPGQTGTGATGQQDQTSATAQPGQAGTGSAAGAAPQAGSETVSGRVIRASEDEVVLQRGSGERELRLSVGPGTAVKRNGERASVTELQEGTEVRASYTVQDGGRPVATEIQVSGQE